MKKKVTSLKDEINLWRIIYIYSLREKESRRVLKSLSHMKIGKLSVCHLSY